MALALGVETSCDDTSVSLVTEDGEALFLASQSQNSLHAKYGGILPEAASRQHEAWLLPLIEEALKAAPLSQIDVIAASSRPGLLGSLLTGLTTAKTLSMAWGKPFIGVNHIEAHIFSPFLWKKNLEKTPRRENSPAPPEKRSEAGEPASGRRRKSPPGRKKPEACFPALALVVSGGHSSLFYVRGAGKSVLLGSTRDDAAGEALDKFAKMLGLPWPGGPEIDRLSRLSGPRRGRPFFSRIQTDDLSFSFSGLKSAGRRLLQGKSQKWIEANKAALAADYQEAAVAHLMEKTREAFKKHPCRQILVGGGVSANSLLSRRMKEWAERQSVQCLFPEKAYCADNAAMIALTGLKYFLEGKTSPLDLNASPRHLEKDFFTRLRRL